MASMLLLFFPALFASSLLLHPMHASIPLGSSLSPTTKNASWLSPSGLFAFGFYNQGSGFAVGVWLETHPNKTIVWTANRDDPPVPPSAKLFLTEGGLLLQTPGSQDKNISGYIFSSPATSASLLDSGNFILYDSRSEIIWETFGFPTDTILAGQKLFVGNQLVSSISDTNHSTGRFRMNMQEDENLVLYSMGTDDTPENAYWASMTNGRTRIRSLYLNISGYIGLVDSGNSTIMQLLGEHLGSRSGTIVYRATLDTDGIFRRYSHHFMWNNVSVERDDVTPVSTKCLVKGICGINSYCIQMDAPKYDCFCLPGYKFKDPNQQLMGCFRNFSDEDCMGKKDRMTYFITPERNMTWQDHSYEILQSNSEEDCKAKCLGDCFCGAAVFDGQNCNKLRIPLKYGIRDTSVSATTMIKVGTESTVNTNTNETVFTEIERKSRSHKGILIVSVTLATCLTFIFAIAILLVSKHDKKQHYRKMLEERNLAMSEEIVLQSYSYKELQKATSNFSEELGKGAFGTVYKGAISNGTRIIAVKKLEKVVEEGEREFRREMRAIGRTHHRNLVRLIGFCDEGSSRLLVYEYMSNGSLADLLFKAENKLDWNERVRIALDVATGIHYLHEDCEPHIIHCDIKPENILMDDSWTAKISDFGLAKLLMPNQTRTFTGIRGTRGYLAPEWHKNMPISVKTDVYSYGMVLLEIICCRRNIKLEVPCDQMILYEWVYNCFVARKLGELLGGEEVEGRMLERMVKVGLWCIQNEPPLRPTMKNVILMLEGNMEIPIPPSPTSSSMS
ncbi:hypothetical protein AAC387_Pa07g3727 [Persea americana]